MSKPARTIEQQLILLSERNLSFKNADAARQFLSNISYYRLKGYWWEMQDNPVDHHFRDGSFFEDALELYNFDRRFRLIVFNGVERIEIALRTKLIYHLSLAFGPEWHLEPSLFDKPKEHLSFLSKISGDLCRSSEEFIVKHYQNHSHEHPESWKALEVLTMGSLSKLYQNLRHQLPAKNDIAREFGLYNQKYLVSWLLALTVIRNIIAHHSRLWNRVIINKYDWPTDTPSPLLSYTPDNYQRRKIFPLLSALIYLNNHVSPGHHLRHEIFHLLELHPHVQPGKMGFPSGWRNEPVWA